MSDARIKIRDNPALLHQRVETLGLLSLNGEEKISRKKLDNSEERVLFAALVSLSLLLFFACATVEV